MMTLEVTVPAGSHSNAEFSDIAITQLCEVKLVTGTGSVQFSFIVDEWAMVTGGQIVNITTTHRVEQTTVTALQSIRYPELKGSDEMYYGEFETAFGPDIEIYSNLTDQIASALELVFDNKTYYSSQGATFCNMLSWGTLPDGFYHPEIMFKGVTAAVATVAHFVFMVCVIF